MSQVCAGIQVDDRSNFPSGTNMLISSKLHHMLQLPRSPLTVQLGQKKITSRVQTFASQSSLLRIRSDLAEHLGIPNGTQLNIQCEPKKRRLIFGPVFGVLITRLLQSSEGIFGPATSFCQEIVQEAKTKGVLAYIFTLNDVNQQNQTVNGWTWINGKWIQRQLPLPDTVYNRLASRKSENRPETLAMIEFFKRKGIHYFNEHFLNKWEVHEALAKNQNITAYLPGTQLFRGYGTVKEAVNRYSEVYLKPANGSLGKGIYKISRSGKSFTCQYSTMSGTVRKNYSTLAKLYASIGPRISKFPYLVQQGLQLVRINGNPLDFRSLAQKDRAGKWVVTSIVGRIGQEQSIVSNLARGGTIMTANEALAAAGPWRGVRPTRNQLSRTSQLLAEGLESSIEGHFGELGIDLAVDIRGRIWVLEINAKPSKNDDQVITEQQKTRPSVKKLLDYSLFLKNMAKPTQVKRKATVVALKSREKKRKKR